MQCNEKLFGRPVEARNPATDEIEVMIFQGLSELNVPRTTEVYPYAICEDGKGILRVISVDDMRFIDNDISTQTTIRRYSLKQVSEEDMMTANLIDRDDIYDETREHKVKIKNIVIQRWENPDNEWKAEKWPEAVDEDGHHYLAHQLYWKGPEK